MIGLLNKSEHNKDEFRNFHGFFILYHVLRRVCCDQMVVARIRLGTSKNNNTMKVDMSMETFDVLFDLLCDTSGVLDEAWGNDCLTLILDLLLVSTEELQRHVLKCISKVCIG